MLIIVGIGTILVTILFPTLSFATPAIAFITATIFFTMENPDATLINKLNEAKSIAEDANDAKTSFLSSMSHEIRTPLNAIVGFGQALAKEDISGTAKEEIQDILMASNTLLDIVNGILDIQKIEANKIELVKGEYKTKKMISEITSLINARIGSKPIDFKVLVDEKLPAVLYGDCIRVKQIAINLLTNAVKYTKEGRILFQVKAQNERDICRLTLQVQDTGMGMTEEDLEKLFTKFQRFDMNKKPVVQRKYLRPIIWGYSKKDIWNKSAYIHRNSAKTLRFIVGYIRQVCALDKSAVFFSCSHLNALSLCLFSNSFFSSPFAFAAKPCYIIRGIPKLARGEYHYEVISLVQGTNITALAISLRSSAKP